MRDVILVILAVAALAGLVAVHARGGQQRRVLALTIFFDVVVGGLTLIAWQASRTFESWMQEDSWAEWTTVFAFAIAAGLIAQRLLRWRREPEVSGWLAPLGLLGVALFCVFVAGEEISWGQRLLAFQPPEIFLQENYQQELNVHNLLTKKKIAGFRMDSRFLVAVIAIVYGAAIPGLRRWSKVPALQPTLDTIAPSLALAPWFAVVALVELSYPADLGGEACEMVLGLLFLAAAVIHDAPTTFEAESTASPRRAALLLLAPIGLGVVTPPLVGRLVYGVDEALVAQAQTELELLRSDLLEPGVMRKKLRKKRRVHKRVFTAVQAKYFDLEGGIEFLEGQASPATEDAENPRRDRKGYFLDPWNNPYWILVTKKGRRGILYSFGPNRRRDTKMPKKKLKKSFEAHGDDIVVKFSLSKSAPKPAEAGSSAAEK